MCALLSVGLREPTGGECMQQGQTTLTKNEVIDARAFPFLDLKAQFATIREEVRDAVDRVFESQHFILGAEVNALEDEIARFTECTYAIGCASGSDALLLALMALNVGPGDEVIAPPFTFVATIGAIARLGARPVFVDIAPDTYNLDPALLESAITPKTRAIIPVHLFGLTANMDRIGEIAEAHGIDAVEDAAQALGARYIGRAAGSFGTAGCFSFFPSKNLGSAGDGGMITTNSAPLNDRFRVLRVHGSRNRYEYEQLGINSRLDTLQAAILKVKLKYLEEWTSARRRNAALYKDLFAQENLEEFVTCPIEPEGYFHVYNQFTIRVRDRDALRTYLKQQGIPTEVYYPYPLHLQPAFKYLNYRPGDFPVAEAACKSVVSLPIYPEMSEEQLHSVVFNIAKFYRER
jgi:dTDP-4-amino-4,6-dideoxygalactose transaminase